MILKDPSREGIFNQTKDMYEKGKFSKEMLRHLVGRPMIMTTQYITEEEYKIITGEDYVTPKE